MPAVETVNGPVDVEELGLTLIHEHFRATDEAGRAQFPHLYDEQGEWDAAMADANAVKGPGVKTVVEPSAMFLHRDAAFSKCAADGPGLPPPIGKIPGAAARASIQRGKPIMAHSRPASGTGLEQMRIFDEEGVDPAKVQIAHTGDTDDLRYIEKLLATGCWIGMDRYGLDIFLPTEQRQATVLALLEQGHADRMFLSQDYCSTIDWFPLEVQDELA